MTKKSKIFVCFLGTFLTTLLVIIMYLVEGVYPGSNKTIIVYDEATQYCAIWQYMRYIFSGEESLFLNWSIGLGGNNLCQMAYYLGCPINAIVALFPIESMPEVIYWLTISKYALASFSFGVYCCFFRKDIIQKKYIVIFSMSYGLMSYMVIYSMSLMWIDAVIILPIVIGSLERIQYSRIYFIISLTLVFYTNFYIGYMIAIFSIFYLLWLFCYDKLEVKLIKKTIYQFIISGLFAFGLASPILIPTALGLLNGKGQEESVYNQFFTNDISNILVKFFSCQYDTIRMGGSPNFFVGTFVLLLCLFFFVSKSVNKKAKICSTALIIFFIISFWISPLNNIWHGFRAPIAFPGRYSFCFSFFLIIIGIEGIKHFDEFSISNKYLMKYRIALMFLFCVVTVVELWVNGSYILGTMRSECYYIKREELKDNYLMTTEALNSIDDDTFYRVDTDTSLTFNDSMLYGYDGLSYFSSTYNYNVNCFFKSIGASKVNYVISSDGILPGIREIVANKYFFSNKEQNIPGFDIVNQTENMYLYANSNAISLGEILECPDYCTLQDNIFENINNVVSVFKNNCEIYLNNTIYKTEETINDVKMISLSVVAESDGPLFIYFTGESAIEKRERKNSFVNKDKSYIDYAKICYDDEKIDTLYFSDGTYPVYICDACIGEVINIQIETNYNCGNFYSASFQQSEYDRFINRSNDKLDNIIKNKNTITCTGTFIEDGILFFSIPYSNCFSIYIDGKKVSTTSCFDTFLCCNVEEGKHTIVISYFPKGIYVGCVIFTINISLIILFYLLNINVSKQD